MRRFLRTPTVAVTLCLMGCALSPAWAVQDFLKAGPAPWRYAFNTIPLSAVPQEVFAPGYSDADWASGHEPFGIVDNACIWTLGTIWPSTTTTMVARISINIPIGTTRLVVGVRNGDGAYRYYVNGRLWLSLTHSGGCTGIIDGPITPWPPDEASVWRLGDNLIVLAAENHGGSRVLEAYAFGDVLPVSNRTGTWGRPKALYR